MQTKVRLQLPIRAMLLTLSTCTLGVCAALFCVQVNTIRDLRTATEVQALHITDLEARIIQLQYSYLGHVSQQQEFQHAMKRAAGKAGYWWAYVQLGKAQQEVTLDE